MRIVFTFFQCSHNIIRKKPARAEEILTGMAAGGYIHRPQQEELLRGAAAAGLSAEDQAGLAAGSVHRSIAWSSWVWGGFWWANPPRTLRACSPSVPGLGVSHRTPTA